MYSISFVQLDSKYTDIEFWVANVLNVYVCFIIVAKRVLLSPFAVILEGSRCLFISAVDNFILGYIVYWPHFM